MNSKKPSFFSSKGVIRRKNPAFKNRCESAVPSLGLSKSEFYFKSEISRQRWYFWSWGLEIFPSYIKIRLCDSFGKPFRDLFLGEAKK